LKVCFLYRGADKSLARPGRKQSRKHVRNTWDFNNIEKRAATRFFSLQGKAPKKIHAILTETLACFLPGRAKDLSALLYFDEGNWGKTWMVSASLAADGSLERKVGFAALLRNL